MSQQKWDSHDVPDQKGRVAIVTGRSKRAEYTGERIKIKTVVIGGRQKSGQITQYDPGSAWHEVC